MLYEFLKEENGSLRYYKANLHCHTTVSDGCLTPEEMKALYKAEGYSALAFTDHEVFLTHNDLTDDSFVALNGAEYAVNFPSCMWADVKKKKPTCHICTVALSPDTRLQPLYHRSQYFLKSNVVHQKQLTLEYDDTQKDYTRHYSGEGITDYMTKLRKAGFFVTYNHPNWSQENQFRYSNYSGMHAMEIYNNGATVGGYDEDGNESVYTDLIRQGKRIYCIAADDAHIESDRNGKKFDAFGGYVYIAAEKLEYRALTSALEAGRFFAGTGRPGHESAKILSLCYESDTRTVTVKTEPARNIRINTALRWADREWNPDGSPVEEAVFSLPEDAGYFRITVQDAEGYKTYSNAYFLDEIAEKGDIQ